MVKTQLLTTAREFPPMSLVTGANRKPFAKPPKANWLDMKKPKSASVKPRSFFKITDCAEDDMELAVELTSFTMIKKPASLKTTAARSLHGCPSFGVFSVTEAVVAEVADGGADEATGKSIESAAAKRETTAAILALKK
mmetsp:Transcript_22629/g.63236  ORF Transcript_22629/g.63236 Transcript_22629/m.63236 type:complete len:139 (-) Transcript_22629:685-1101(-)